MFSGYFFVFVFHISNKHLLNVNCVSVTVLGAGESEVKDMSVLKAPHNLENFGKRS